MESNVASTSNTDDLYDDVKCKDSVLATEATIPVISQNCNNETDDTLATVDSIDMMECKTETIKKSGASPKLSSENKIPNSHNEMSSKADVGVGPVSTDGLYFFEDVVFSFDKKGQVMFGLVMETSVEEEDDEELDKGEVRVVWYSLGNEEIYSEYEIGLADRTLMPGDAVRRMVPGKETQRGYCREINMRADVKVLGTRYVIENVNAERLICIHDWQTDSAVCLDSWVGSIKGVEMLAVLRAGNGCRFEICSNDFYCFEGYNSTNADIFYPGNIIKGKLPAIENIKILTPEIPLGVSKKGHSMPRRFTIESVRTDSVWVHWQCKALSDDTNLQSASRQPFPCVRGEDLKRLKSLNLFESCMLQLHDRNYLVYSSCDKKIKKSDWKKEQSAKFKPIFEQQLQQNRDIFGEPRNQTVSDLFRLGIINAPRSIRNEKIKNKNRNLSKCALHVGPYSSGEREDEDHDDNNDNLKNVDLEDEENEWVSTDDEQEGGEKDWDVKSLTHVKTTEDAVSTTTTHSTCSTPSSYTSTRTLTKRQLRKKRKTMNAKLMGEMTPKDFNPQVGDELVTEALLVYSTATVVWQDGTVEQSVPSTQLYPIHHLDSHEFFPGDFVIYATEQADVTYRDYGVIQMADHEGRTAHVKWFTTYASADEPKPNYKGTSEVSVYDLKDHPDFQYRPGTMVIRVANFVGEDANCTAGQILDNNPDGRVKVWWVDGHMSMCWPQDLFEVGHYDHGEWGHESEDSWETESESSEVGARANNRNQVSIAESQLLANIEKARAGIARLIDIFTISPNLQNNDVMRNLLAVYKGCRYFDRLLSTSFFHEDNFMGLIERVRRVGNQTMHERAQDQKNRLFNDSVPVVTSPCAKKEEQQYQYSAIVAVNSSGIKPPVTQQMETLSGQSSKEYAPKVLFNLSSTPYKNSTANNSATHSNAHAPSSPSLPLKRRCSPATAARQSPAKRTEVVPNEESSNCDNTLAEVTSNIEAPQLETSPNKNKQYNAEKHQLLNSTRLNIEKAVKRTSQLKAFADGCSVIGFSNTSTSEDDSGNFSRNIHFDCSLTSCTSSSDIMNIDTNNSLPKDNENNNSMSKDNDNGDNIKSESIIGIELPEDAAPELVCARLCTMLKDQLVKCIDEIRKRYYKDETTNLSDIADSDTPIDIESYVNGEVEAETAAATNEITEAMENIIAAKIKASDGDVLPATPASPASPISIAAAGPQTSDCFQIMPTAPKSHKYHVTIFNPTNRQQYYKAVQKEHKMLRNCLPPGVLVRTYEDRMDLLSVLIEGPKKTPYEDGMFIFDMQLGREYPNSPPVCHYISYVSDRLNPNLYEEGKVCVSLLGTWTGTNTEVWGPKSTLLQVIVSIQGLILNAEPYYNEAGYEKQKGTQQGRENSRMYNEMVVIKMVQATIKMIANPPEAFRVETLQHLRKNGLGMHERIKGWMELSKLGQNNDAGGNDINNSLNYSYPEFPLVPASRGFCLTINGLLENLKQKLIALDNEPKTISE